MTVIHHPNDGSIPAENAVNVAVVSAERRGEYLQVKNLVDVLSDISLTLNAIRAAIEAQTQAIEEDAQSRGCV